MCVIIRGEALRPGAAAWGLSAAPRARPALTVKNKARLAAHSAGRTFLLNTTAFKWHMQLRMELAHSHPSDSSAFTHILDAQKSHLCTNRECHSLTTPRGARGLCYIFKLVLHVDGTYNNQCNYVRNL